MNKHMPGRKVTLLDVALSAAVLSFVGCIAWSLLR